MGDGPVNVDYESLIELEDGFGRFFRVVTEYIEASKALISRISDELADRQTSLLDDIDQLNDDIAEAEHDDRDSLIDERDDLKEQLFAIRRRERRFEDTVANYRREADRAETLGSEVVSEMRTRLRSLSESLIAYFRLANDVPSDRASSEIMNSTNAGLHQDDAPFDPTSFDLPDGFHWTPVASIAATLELRLTQTELQFRKTSYAEIRRGFAVLQTVILPILRGSENAVGSMTFAMRDSLSGKSYETGEQRVYDAFFGDDPIHLTRGRGDSVFDITDGQHRIKVAIDEGWAAVPATTNDMAAE